MPLLGVSTRSHVSPPSRLRQAPPSSTPNHTSSFTIGLTHTVRSGVGSHPGKTRVIRRSAPASWHRHRRNGTCGRETVHQFRRIRATASPDRRRWPTPSARSSAIQPGKCAPPSVLMHMPASAPASTRAGSDGSTARLRTTPSNSIASFNPRRCQVVTVHAAQNALASGAHKNGALHGMLLLCVQMKMPRVMPPSTAMDSPVMAAARSDARNKTTSAISVGCSTRLIGVALA